MKVIIAGSRSIQDFVIVRKAVVQSGYEISEVVSGKAVGVDRLGERYAALNNIPVKEMPANWDTYDKRAGPIRNKAMAEYTDAAVIIYDGKSPGTKNMIAEMTKLNKPYHLVMTIPNLEKFFE